MKYLIGVFVTAHSFKLVLSKLWKIMWMTELVCFVTKSNLKCLIAHSSKILTIQQCIGELVPLENLLDHKAIPSCSKKESAGC